MEFYPLRVFVRLAQPEKNGSANYYASVPIVKVLCLKERSKSLLHLGSSAR
jgi:hypothetical protein